MREVYRARGPMPLSEARPVAKQVADAVKAAHDHGVIHRDLEPAANSIDATDDIGRLPAAIPEADGARSMTVVLNWRTRDAQLTPRP